MSTPTDEPRPDDQPEAVPGRDETSVQPADQAEAGPGGAASEAAAVEAAGEPTAASPADQATAPSPAVDPVASPAPPLPSWAGPTTGETPVVPEDLPATPIAEPKAETPGQGQHAAARPYPPAPTVTRVPSSESLAATRAGIADPPPPAGAPVPAPVAPPVPAPAPAPAETAEQTAVVPPPVTAPAPGPGSASTAVLPTTPALAPAEPARTERAIEVELPEPPAKPGAARHVLGVLVGLVLTPIALVLAGIGVGRFLAVDETATSLDTTGLGLLLIGGALLALVVLLGLWSPAVPLTGGLLWGVGVGVLYIGWPQLVEDAFDSAYSTRPPALDQLTSALNDGTWLLLGLLVTVAGLTLAIARRMGRRFGERRMVAEHARAEAVRAQDARRRAAEAEEAALAERARAIA